MGRPILITGGRGYIGAVLVGKILAAGREAFVLSRSVDGLPKGARHLEWRLGEPLPQAARGAEALIHLAHDWSETGALEAARTLRDSARSIGVDRTVFASSVSARQDALNAYGQGKWAAEQLFDGPGEVSVRIGLVYGGPRRAMYGLLCKLVSLPVLPMIAPGQGVQPVHVGEVADGLLAAADRGLSGVVGLAAAEPVAFRDFLKALALNSRGRRLLVLPIPTGPMLLLAAAVSWTPLAKLLSRERILGLAGTRPLPTGEDLGRLGLQLAPFAGALAAEPMARKRRLAEGRAFLRYILVAEPGPALIRRYARAVGPAAPLPLGGAVLRSPALLRLIEPLGAASELSRRLRIASALAEASPIGERRLARTGLIGLGLHLILEGLAMPFRLLATAAAR